MKPFPMILSIPKEVIGYPNVENYCIDGMNLNLTGVNKKDGSPVLRPEGAPGWILFLELDHRRGAPQQTWLELSPDFTPVGSQYWQLLDILDGLPWILQSTTESFLPQLLNMDQLQAVSFNKGCFPGQEVIARLQHRGKVKQRLLIAILENGTDIGPGVKVYQNGEEQSIGTIINIARHPGEGLFVLAVINTDHGTADQLQLKNDAARFTQIKTPSYLIHP